MCIGQGSRPLCAHCAGAGVSPNNPRYTFDFYINLLYYISILFMTGLQFSNLSDYAKYTSRILRQLEAMKIVTIIYKNLCL